MKVSEFTPEPTLRWRFHRAEERFVNEGSGCYVLTTFDQDVLYVGLSRNLRRRFRQHLDTPEKIAPTEQGRVVWFYWMQCDQLEKIERTWLNAYKLRHGALPILNKVDSPTSM